MQQGLIARLAYAGAAGWLASQGLTAHPVSLALCDRERVGRRELWPQHKALRSRRPVPAWEQDDAWLDADEKITRALALARLLERLPAADNPLVDAARAEAWLAPLAPQATPFDPRHFAVWRAAHAPDGCLLLRRTGAADIVPPPRAPAAVRWRNCAPLKRPDWHSPPRRTTLPPAGHGRSAAASAGAHRPCPRPAAGHHPASGAAAVRTPRAGRAGAGGDGAGQLSGVRPRCSVRRSACSVMTTSS